MEWLQSANKAMRLQCGCDPIPPSNQFSIDAIIELCTLSAAISFLIGCLCFLWIIIPYNWKEKQKRNDVYRLFMIIIGFGMSSISLIIFYISFYIYHRLHALFQTIETPVHSI